MNYFYALLFLFPGIGANAQVWYEKPDHTTDYDLNGPVKKLVYDNHCQPAQSGIRSNLGCYYEFEFNSSGWMTRLITRHDTGTLADSIFYSFTGDTLLTTIRGGGFDNSIWSTYSYDNQSRLIEIKTTRWDGTYDLLQLTYDDEKNKMYSTKRYIMDQQEWLGDRLVHVYDSARQLIMVKNLGRKDVPYRVKTFEYSERGQIIATSTWTALPKKKGAYVVTPEWQWEIFGYDSTGNLIEETHFIDLDKKILSTSASVFNDKGNLVFSKDTLYLRGYSNWSEIEYDSLGRKTLGTSYDRSGMNSYTLYAYDAEGRLILEEQHQRRLEIVVPNRRYEPVWRMTERKQYEYDHYNNWIKMYYLDYDGAEKTATRQITYYD